MSTIKAKVTQSGLTRAKVTPQQEVVVTNYQFNALNVSLDELVNVDATNAQDGSLLQYDATSQTWRAVAKLENTNTEFNGGFF